MPYATPQDVLSRLGPDVYIQLTDDENTGTANETRIEEALQAAQAEINSRLICRYATPVDVSEEPEAAALLKALTLDLATQRLHARKPPVPDAVQEAAASARQWLCDVATGRALLPATRELPENQATGIIAGIAGTETVQWDG